MCDFRLKTSSGAPLRSVYSDFEIRATKFAVDSNMTDDAHYQYGNDGENFRVVENSDTYVKVLRVKTNKYIEFNKVVKVEDCTKVVHNDVKSAPVVPAAVPVAPVADGNNNDVTVKIMAALTPAIAAAVGAAIPAPATPVVDVDTINNIIDGRIAGMAADMVSIKDSIKNLCVRHDISINNAPAVHIDGVLHPAFNLALLNAKSGVPSYLYGPAGTGKNVLSEQIAKALGLQYYYAASLQNKYEIEGFIDASGTYQETQFYKAFTTGGVFMMDELDSTASEVSLALNEALATGCYAFPKVGFKQAHKDFIFIAAGNTNGHGATDAYCGRYCQDASLLNRCAPIRMAYDKNIDMAACNNDADLYAFAIAIRAAIKKQNLTYTISPRNLKRVVTYMANKIDMHDVIMMGVCGDWDDTDIKLVAANIGLSNKYAKAFADYANNL